MPIKRVLLKQKTLKPLSIKAFSAVPGAGIEPARPQWPQDFKYYATLQNATKRDKREQKEAKGDKSAHQKRTPKKPYLVSCFFKNVLLIE